MAKEGAIIPLDCNDTANDFSNPINLELLVFRGNSSFTLYEDDGETIEYQNGKYAETVFTVREDTDSVEFTIDKAIGDFSVFPSERKYLVSFRDVMDAEQIFVSKNGRICRFARIADPSAVRIQFNGVLPSDTITITLRKPKVRRSPDRKELKIELISKTQGNNARKAIYRQSIHDDFDHIPSLMQKPFEELEHLY